MRKNRLFPFLMISILLLTSCAPSPESLYKEANYYHSKGEYHKTIRTLLTLIKKYPSSTLSPMALKMMGEIYLFEMKKEKPGLELLKKVSTYFPGTTEAAKALEEAGDYLFRKGDYNSAISIYRRLLTYPIPTDIRKKTLKNLIYSYLFIGDSEELIHYIESFLREFSNDPSRWELMMLEADNLYENGKQREGEAILKKVIKNAPAKFQTQAEYSLGNHYITQGKYRDALLIFYQLKNNPEWKDKVERKISMVKEIIYNKHRYK